VNYQRLCEILAKYIPLAIVGDAADLIVEYKAVLKIKKPRSSKLGDYRSPAFNGRHTISVNKDLNTYAFAVTLLHELAHMICFERHKNRVKPHGAEWKLIFIDLASPYFNKTIFPTDVEEALQNYFQNPGASTCSDPALLKVLNNYNAEPSIYVDDIREGEFFELDNGRVFLKGKRRRTRYSCICQDNKREYLVSGVAKIKRIV